MKSVLFLFSFLAFTSSYGQDARPLSLEQLVKESQGRLPYSRSFSNQSAPVGQRHTASVLQPDSLKRLVRLEFPSRPAVGKSTRGMRTMQGQCKDTSYRRLIGVENCWMFLRPVTQTRDGNFIVPIEAYDTTTPATFRNGFGVLLKMDEEGNVLWIKQFNDLTPSSYNSLILDMAFELPNGDIVCTGFLSIDASTSVYKTLVYRLDANGNMVWKTLFKSKLAIFNSPVGTFTYWVQDVREGLNGDLILCGTSNSNNSSGHIETVVRLDKNGTFIWDANYGNHGYDGSYLFGAEGIRTFMKNGQLMLVGLSHGTNNPSTPPAVNFLALDYNTGNELSRRFVRPLYTDKTVEFLKSFTFYDNNCRFLSNGHLLFYGKLFSDYANMTTVKDHFGVIEFDENLKPVDSYTITSTLKTNYYNNLVYFDSTGRGLATIFEFLDAYEGNAFFGAFEKGQFLNQRKYHYHDIGLPRYSSFAFLRDGGYVHFQSYFENNPTKSYFEFRKMHNSDTASQCLGKDTLLFGFSSLNVVEDPLYWLLDPNDPGKLEVLTQNISETDTLTSLAVDPCKQTNFCDTVKIHGTPVICGSVGSIEFTAFKNVDCGGIVQWNIDNSAIDSLHVVTDTSIRIWFKNVNWRGKLYATLPAGACYLPALDSTDISIVRLQKGIYLGNDTTLCKGNSLQLHAGKSFTTYLWQDGTSDSLFRVTNAGTYWVQASDLCGNNFADTIIVAPLTVTVDIGPDRTKCNSDTLHLNAPPGFLNYSWSNNYNISSLTSQNVTINPLTDTAYYIKAEKTPGCFAYDTLRVRVNTSPRIDLGADKSFCSGDSVVFDAGTGFAQYNWSNGANLQKMTVTKAGSYSLMAVTIQGCKSYDTVKVVNVYTNPVVLLDHTPFLCTGSSRTLDPGSFASYIWSDGSTQQKVTVGSTGMYAVQVTDNNGCKGSDTTIITAMLALPADFLPADTLLCSYDKLAIASRNSYSSYLWSTGSILSSEIISQPGTYWLQVKDGYGCVGKDSIIISPKDCMKGIYVPTAFSPNGDGKNDLFHPLLFGNVKKYSFTIYNRWGAAVFQSTELNRSWDGRIAGVLQDSNVFTWICTYQFEGEQVKSEKGTVMLVR
ncbi:MAG: T9SS type B sorting domain-containing protein [Flavisolibacter sp.]